MTFPDTVAPRCADWHARLADYLGRVAGAAFRPGAHDCALFAAGAVEAMTGQDLAAGWRGTYRSLEEGRAALQAAGYPDQVALVAALFPEVAPAWAHLGDLAVVPGEAGPALGVIQGAGVYVLRPSGLAIVSRLTAEKAFRV